MAEDMFKGIVERINKGDSSITEREIALGTYYELKSLNDKIENLENKFETSVESVALRTEDLRKTVKEQMVRVDNLEDFRIEYTSYIKLIPGASLLISIITGIIVLWKSLGS